TLRHQQKGRRDAGLFSIQMRSLRARKSVFRDNRAAPAVVDASGDHVGVTMNAVGANNRAGTGRREGGEVVADEQMVVLNSDRPVRDKAEFEAGADRRPPAVI